MKRVKIVGAGSIGNHLSNAARTLGWDVVLCDVDPEALRRTREMIYPQRYGAWDDGIELCLSDDAPTGGFDMILIGTPPDSHVALTDRALDEKPAALLVEKPFATPDLAGCQALYDKARKLGVRTFVGYDHAIAASVRDLSARIADGAFGEVLTLDAAFREHWQGIFNAHPWLDGPKDSYLGYWQRGGGAGGEHSHAIHLWQTLAHASGGGRVVEVAAEADYFQDGVVSYDRIMTLHLRTESGLLGRVVQDVVTKPSLKWASVQGDAARAEWRCAAGPYRDIVTTVAEEETAAVYDKTRPDDFVQELTHIAACLDGGVDSPLTIERGMETMMVIAAAHRSAREGRRIAIDYRKGYAPAALSPRE